MDILVPIGILLGASGLPAGCALAVLARQELRGLSRHLELARIVLFALCAILAAVIIPHWAGAALVMVMLALFVWMHALSRSDMIAQALLAVALLFGAASLRAHLVSLVFLFGLPAGSLFVYNEGITGVRAALSRMTVMHGPLMLGALFLVVILSVF